MLRWRSPNQTSFSGPITSGRSCLRQTRKANLSTFLTFQPPFHHMLGCACFNDFRRALLGAQPSRSVLFARPASNRLFPRTEGTLSCIQAVSEAAGRRNAEWPFVCRTQHAIYQRGNCSARPPSLFRARTALWRPISEDLQHHAGEVLAYPSMEFQALSRFTSSPV